MIVLSDNDSLTDILLAQFGYYTQDEFLNIAYKATDDENYNQSLWKDKFSYEEILGKTFTWYPNNSVYSANAGNAKVPYTYNYASQDWEDGIELTITAILSPKEDISYGCMQSGFYYTQALAEYILQDSANSNIVNSCKLMSNQTFTGYYVDSDNYGGITYNYSYTINGTKTENCLGFVGSSPTGIMANLSGGTKTYTLSLRSLGGKDIPSTIKIYPTDFNYKDNVTEYLALWNSDQNLIIGDKTLTKQDRTEEILWTDTLSIVIGLVNNLVNIVTTALVAFTALSLVVSTVMVAIITYVSVMERVKEIGVIRSLGGRKRDVSSLFIAETFIIGSISGIFGIAITYLLSAIINLIVGNIVGIYTIASLNISTALMMIAISILLTLISGLIPASLAAKKDPVVALRSE